MTYEEFEQRALATKALTISTATNIYRIECPKGGCNKCGFSDPNCILVDSSYEKEHLPAFLEKHPEVLV